jgi:D-alanyl-D-alanine carboxypeptidase
MLGMEESIRHIPIRHPRSLVFFYVVLAVLLGCLGFGSYKYFNLHKELQNTKTSVETLNKNLSELRDENDYVKEKLLAEENKNSMFEEQISGIAGTIGTLDKLSKTDKELLQKYSKVYFLNEHYVPKKLVEIPEEYVYEKTRVQQFNADAWPFLEGLFREATSSNIKLEVISTYRSFYEQSSLKNSYKVTYGAGTANKFSADQGYSEHQLGTAIDFTTVKLGSNFTNFKNDPAYKWLMENAYKYGFVLSYPENNTYYQFEPWHWRFVGKKLAERLHEEGQYFYDLDQRKIDSYLVNLFDE